MKLNNFLTEGNKSIKYPHELIDLIKSECQPFLKDLKKSGSKKWLGRNIKVGDDHGYRAVRRKREPRDTSLLMHTALDEYYLQEYGFRARSNGVFCSGKESWGSAYGNPYIIFPKGNYKIIWNKKIEDSLMTIGPMSSMMRELYADDIKKKYPDLYAMVVEEMGDDTDKSEITWKAGVKVMNWFDKNERRGIPLKDWPDWCRDMFLMRAERMGYDDYTVGDLAKGIESETEMILHCKGYYYIKRYGLDIIPGGGDPEYFMWEELGLRG